MAITKRIVLPALIATSLLAFSKASLSDPVSLPPPAAATAMDAGINSRIETKNELAPYLVKVEATPEIQLDAGKLSIGQLKVWIGSPSDNSGKIASARIIPQFPEEPTAFRVEPEDSPCQALDPAGTEVSFALTPMRAGHFMIGASIDFYESPECRGAALTKTVAPVTVNVTGSAPQTWPLLSIPSDRSYRPKAAPPAPKPAAGFPASTPVEAADGMSAARHVERESTNASPASSTAGSVKNYEPTHARVASKPGRVRQPPATAAAAITPYETSSSPVAQADELVSHLVKVEATQEIKMSIDRDKPSSGLLAVWIGNPSYEPKNTSGMAAASNVLQTIRPAASAKVIPSFPDDPNAFKVEPEKSACQSVDPTGTRVPFTITPTRVGKFRVGASVELYKHPECRGDVLTKTAEPVTVKVTIYMPESGILETIWAAIEKFIGEILAALSAALIIVFRKRLMKLFGIKKEP